MVGTFVRAGIKEAAKKSVKKKTLTVDKGALRISEINK